MLRSRPLGGSSIAFAGSVVLHASLLAMGAWLLARGLSGSGPAAPPAAVAQPVELEPDMALPEMAAAGPASEEPSKLAPPLEVTTGGRHAPRPDLEAAGRGGERTSRDQAMNLASSIDPIALERDAPTQRDRSQVSRLHTAWERASRDDRRATPTPMELTFLATGSGHVRARRNYAPSDPARGILSGSEAATLGSKAGDYGATATGADDGAAAGGPIAGSDAKRFGQGAPDGRDQPEFHASARVLFARPLVPMARAAVPSEERGRPNDTLDSSQEVAARVSSLLHASTAGGDEGPGVGGERAGGAPGVQGQRGMGSRSSPSGAGFGKDFSDDPGFDGYWRALNNKLQRVLAKAFPDWAIEQGRGGHVIFEMTLGPDGRPSGVQLVRPSGIAEYDQNVLTAVRGVASFGRLPSATRVRVSWDALNPIIGRQGSGPGGGHRAAP